jgi:hypothetical protein
MKERRDARGDAGEGILPCPLCRRVPVLPRGDCPLCLGRGELAEGDAADRVQAARREIIALLKDLSTRGKTGALDVREGLLDALDELYTYDDALRTAAEEILRRTGEQSAD